jgi:Protein of unknown function (DUF3300)
MKPMLDLKIPAALVSAALFLMPSMVRGQQAPPPLPPPGQALAPDQLDGLVAPIALYPDELVSQILVASTYPLELVEAGQWLQRNPGLTGPALTQAAQQQNWDPSVQALVVFPDLVKRLNQDITWTTNLGNAFLAQQGDVMDAVQQMRRSAEQSGKLASTPQQRVSDLNEDGRPVIGIQPADPNMMYLPNYDPGYIWGPSLYYPYANWGYPPFIGGAYFGFGFGIPMGLYFGGGWGGWGGWGWGMGWGNRSLYVNNSFIHRNGFNAARGASLSGRSNWAHDASHRGGVPYGNAAVSSRYGGNVRQNLQTRGAAAGAARNAGAAGERSQDAGGARNQEKMGNRQVSPSSSGKGNAFGGVKDGSAARTQSDHGYSSLGPSRSGGASAPRPSGGGGGGGAAGGAHGGGGGHH